MLQLNAAFNQSYKCLVYLMKIGVSLSARLVVLPCLLSESLSQVVSSVLQLVPEDQEALANLGHPVFIHRHTQDGIKGLD